MKFWVFFYLLLFFISCQNKEENSLNENILREYRELKQATDASRKLNIKQAQVLNNTLAELAVISGNTIILQQNFERGNARITQAEEISSRIESIKSKIEHLERENNNQEFKETIRHLKVVISGQEKEIVKLKKHIRQKEEEIQEKNQEIRTREHTIQSQAVEINKTNSRLQDIINQQAYLIYQAGADIEQLALLAPDVSRKKNKKKVDDYQRTILRKALYYYEKSASYGYAAAADKIRYVKRKIDQL